MKNVCFILPLIIFGMSDASPVSAGTVLDKKKMVALLKDIDTRVRAVGDFKALVYLEQTEKGKQDLIKEALAYRRDAEDRIMILFTKPKADAGQGYLRVDNNMWSYDPTVGKWDRKTDRERIAGTDARRQDFDRSRLSEEYNPSYAGEEKLGVFNTWVLKLTVKPGVDVAYPICKIWIDQATGNDLKTQDFALSGRLMRTSYIPKWQSARSKAKKKDLWYRQETRIYDEIDKGNSTIMIVKAVDLSPLEPNMFTKAWLESKSR